MNSFLLSLHPYLTTGYLVLVPAVALVVEMAVTYYHRHAVWKHILRSLQCVAGGIVGALITGKF